MTPKVHACIFRQHPQSPPGSFDIESPPATIIGHSCPHTSFRSWPKYKKAQKLKPFFVILPRKKKSSSTIGSRVCVFSLSQAFTCVLLVLPRLQCALTPTTPEHFASDDSWRLRDVRVPPHFYRIPECCGPFRLIDVRKKRGRTHPGYFRSTFVCPQGPPFTGCRKTRGVWK